MTHKLTDIDVDGVLPNEIPDDITNDGKPFNNGQAVGYARAYEEVKELAVDMDILELSKAIYGKTNYLTGDLTKCAEIALAISQNPKILKLTKEK